MGSSRASPPQQTPRPAGESALPAPLAPVGRECRSRMGARRALPLESRRPRRAHRPAKARRPNTMRIGRSHRICSDNLRWLRRTRKCPSVAIPEQTERRPRPQPIRRRAGRSADRQPQGQSRHGPAAPGPSTRAHTPALHAENHHRYQGTGDAAPARSEYPASRALISGPMEAVSIQCQVNLPPASRPARSSATGIAW